nr:hypothetical protein [Dechloromonas sp. TW-R-39-2]
MPQLKPLVHTNATFPRKKGLHAHFASTPGIARVLSLLADLFFALVCGGFYMFCHGASSNVEMHLSPCQKAKLRSQEKMAPGMIPTPRIAL